MAARNGEATVATVTGPGVEGRPVGGSVGAAISCALFFATRPDAPVGTWYVRNNEGRVVAQIERDADRHVTTREVL
jgi:hypothetical protein